MAAKLKASLDNLQYLPIYVGDDVTDEDVFKALKNKGVTVYVGKPKKSYARYFLNNPRDVTKFLKKILHFSQKA